MQRYKPDNMSSSIMQTIISQNACRSQHCKPVFGYSLVRYLVFRVDPLLLKHIPFFCRNQVVLSMLLPTTIPWLQSFSSPTPKSQLTSSTGSHRGSHSETYNSLNRKITALPHRSLVLPTGRSCLICCRGRSCECNITPAHAGMCTLSRGNLRFM